MCVEQGYVMSASISGFYALTGAASKIPIVSRLHESVRALSKSRRASLVTSSSQEDCDQSSLSKPLSTQSIVSQDMVLSRNNLDSQPDVLSDLKSPEWGFKGGVDWETAKMGVSIWHNAVRRMDTFDARRLRQMQIDAVKYMHNALPPDLSENELAILEDSLSTHQNSGRLVLTTRRPVPNLLVDRPFVGNNVIRITVAHLVCWVISFVIFAIPMMMTLLNKGLQYEREHQLSKRVVENGAEIAKAASSVGMDIGEKMLKLRNTEIGIYCATRLAWTFQSMLEGINDGIQSSKSQYYLESMSR